MILNKQCWVRSAIGGHACCGIGRCCFPTVSRQQSQVVVRPARHDWNEALPLGNGRMGAMVFGGIAKGASAQRGESLAAVRVDSLVEGYFKHLQEVRRCCLPGKTPEAETYGVNAPTAHPHVVRSYEPLPTCAYFGMAAKRIHVSPRTPPRRRHRPT